MKKSFINLLLLCLCHSVFAQQPGKHLPLTIQGKITNTTERMMKIFFEDENGLMTIDTIRLNDAGEFNFKTYHITRPQRTSIQQNNLQINRIYVAPGYNLTITGDGTDYLTLLKTRKISGTGAITNSYRQITDSIMVARNDRTGWYELKLDDLLKFIKKSKALNDSVANVVFSKTKQQEKYAATFKKMVDIDNQSMAFYMLLQHLEMGKYTAQQMVDITKQNTPPIFANGISHDEYLIAEDYTSWIMPVYLTYIKKVDKLKDSALVQQHDYSFNTVNKWYTGKVRQRYLHYNLNSGINRASSIEQLNKVKKDFKPFVDAIQITALKKDINAKFYEKEKQLMQIQIGKPAPAFNLPSDQGKTYSLSDFKGKVIYIDLWASWCAPCRAEMPNFQKLSDKYKDNPNVAFVSIAVFDGDREWRKALAVEKPTWLQLYDKGGFVAGAYVANAIPKYILIDKNGNVVNYNAPGPGSNEISGLIDQEMGK